MQSKFTFGCIGIKIKTIVGLINPDNNS